jgi:hypothetical protein
MKKQSGQEDDGYCRPPVPPRFEAFLLNAGYCYASFSCDDVKTYLMALGVQEETLKQIECGFKLLHQVLREKEER